MSVINQKNLFTMKEDLHRRGYVIFKMLGVNFLIII